MNLTPDDPKLTAYALGELDASERAAIEAALARSPECRRAVEEIRALSGELTTALAADTATALRTLPSLAPIGGEGRGEGVSRDALSSHEELHAAAAADEGTRRDFAPSSPSPLPSPPVGAREKSAPGEGKVIFLPWRHWRTLGLAAAAALVVGFFVAKAWLPKQPEQVAKEEMSLPAARAKALSEWAHRPTNRLHKNVITVGAAEMTRTNGFTGLVTVDFGVSGGKAVAGADYIAHSSVLRFAEREKETQLAVPQVATAPSTPHVFFYTATRGQVAWGASRPALAPGTLYDDAVVVTGGTKHWAFQSENRWARHPESPSSTAAYPRYVENPFTLVANEPLSTFSTDVDTASYANVRRFLSQNQLPPRDAVRIEELLNYFTYDYAPPTGPHPFAAHIEVAGCPWAPEHRLVRVGLKGRELKADKRPPSNFVFLIDVSGSMSPTTRLPLIKQSLRQLVKRMTENDRVAMVVYASSSGTVLESTSAVNKEVILSAIDRLEAGGSTNGGEGIQRAYDLAVANFIKGGVNRVLLCTDGDFNVGIIDRGQLLKLIEEKAKSGVFLTTLGVGDDNFKDATLQQLADKGNGNYHYLDSVEEGHKVLVEQMNATLVTIAKDVKIQIEFNPAQASAYRLIGYEKRILAKEDFNNDAKDAGEIGAGHTVTALYEVVPPGVPVRGAVDPLKYQTNNQPAPAATAKSGAASKELLTLKLRYKAPDGDKSTLMEIPVTDSGAKLARASADFKFASAVAEFGMLLKDSPFKGTTTFDGALELAQEGKGNDTHGYRAEFLNLLAKAKALKP